jgi:cytochrome c oxidase subunit 3
MFFAALFAAYFNLRAGSAVWPPAGSRLDPIGPTFGTGLLFISSMVMIAMTRALDRKRERAARAWLVVAIVCAIGFIAIAITGWSHNDFGISTNAYGSIYYAMTGFHLLHVIVGVGLLTALFAGFHSPALRVNRRAGAEAIMYYWHFVFIVWLGIWGTVYFIR